MDDAKSDTIYVILHRFSVVGDKSQNQAVTDRNNF